MRVKGSSEPSITSRDILVLDPAMDAAILVRVWVWVWVWVWVRDRVRVRVRVSVRVRFSVLALILDA